MPEKKEVTSSLPKIEPEKVLFSWKAPTRLYKKRDKEYWIKITSVVSLLGFIFFVAEGIMPVVLLVSVLFLFYVLSSVAPETAEYQITNRGVNIADQKNDWAYFRSFMFIARAETYFLVLNMVSLPGKMEIIIDKKDEEKIKTVLKKYIPPDEMGQTRFDKASEWVSTKIS